MNMEILSAFVLFLAIVVLGCSMMFYRYGMRERAKRDATDWRSDGDRELDRRRAELDAASRERFR